MAHKQLTDRERYQIKTLNTEGYTQTEIAMALKRSPSTIYRELARNSDVKGYRGGLAIKRSDKRRRGAKDKIYPITADRGKECAHHEKVSKALECDYYFAHPYSSWERGLNENTNGLIRQFFPKGSRFEELTERSVKRAKGLLNRRPRKTLGFATPTEVFFGKAFGENFAFQG